MCDDEKKVTRKFHAIPESQVNDINGLLGWVQKQKEKEQKTNKPWGVILTVIFSIVVFFALAIISFRMWKKGREVAKLKHKIDVDEEEKKQLFVDMEISKEAEKEVRLRKEYKAINSRIEIKKLRIEELVHEKKALKDKVDAVTTWKELDNL